MYRICLYALLCLLLTASAQPLVAQKTRRNASAPLKKEASRQKLLGDTCCPPPKKVQDRSAQVIIDSLNRLITRILNRESGERLLLRDITVVTPAAMVTSTPGTNSVRMLISGVPASNGVPLQATLLFDAAADAAAFKEHVKQGSQTLQAAWLNGNRLAVHFREPPSLPAVSPALPAAPSPITQPQNGGSGVAGIVLMVAAALCALAGLAAYFRSRVLLARARAATHHAAPWEVLKEASATGSAAQGQAGSEAAAFMPAAGAVQVPASPAAGLARKHFFAEIMTTAGPRKKYLTEPGADPDLGEDVCGFVADDRELLLYLLDGTSDQHSLRDPESGEEYFSSRLLAQSLANHFRLHFGRNSSAAIDAVVSRAMESVQHDWLRRIERLPEGEKARLRTSIGSGNFPECSTTLIIGELSIEGRATIYRTGDSKMFLFSSLGNHQMRFEPTALMRKNDQSNDRIFFRLALSAGGQFSIQYNKPLFEIVKKENLSTAVVFSDGIGMLTEKSLQHYALDPEQVRRDIIFQAQGTADDKAICFVTIRER